MTGDSEMDAVAEQFASEARSAKGLGATVLTPVISLAKHEDAARAIVAIEAEGSELTNWAVAVDQQGQPSAYPVFRPVFAGGMFPV